MLVKFKQSISEVLSPVLLKDGAYIRERIEFSIANGCFVFHLAKITKKYEVSNVLAALQSLDDISEVSIINGFVNIRVEASFFEFLSPTQNVEIKFNENTHIELLRITSGVNAYAFCFLQQRVGMVLASGSQIKSPELSLAEISFLSEIVFKLFRISEAQDSKKSLTKINDLECYFNQAYLYEYFDHHQEVIYLASSYIYANLNALYKALHAAR